MMFQLRDRGLLPQGLDTEVASILPGFREPRRPAHWRSKRGITLRSLATHSSGLVRDAPPGYSSDERGHLEGIGNSTVLFPMYASTHYSNLGVALLGRALEKVVGKSWERWIQDELLDPLGMNNSGACVRTKEEACQCARKGIERQSQTKRQTNNKDHKIVRGIKKFNR